MEKSQSMYAYLKNSVQSLDEEKIIYQNSAISARKLFADIDAVSTFLYDLGIRKGDSVGVCLPNIPQAIVAIYAINKIGGIVNAIHPRLQDQALYNALIKTKTKVVFMFDFMVLKHNKKLKANNIKVISCAYSDYLTGFRRFYKIGIIPYLDKNIIPYLKTLINTKDLDISVDGNDKAVYLHSSGTSGESKTVVLSSNAFNTLSDNIEEMITKTLSLKVEKDEAMLMVLPVFHGFGLGVCVHFSLHIAKIVMVPFFKTKMVAKALKNNQVNFITAVPNMLKKLLYEPKFDTPKLKNIRLVFSGGDKLNEKVRDNFNALLQKNGSNCKIMEGYGLSEATSVVSINIYPDKNKSQGLPLPNVDIKIISEGKVLPVGETGEICVSSPSAMSGYLNSESPSISVIDGKSYLHTGDLGYLDSGGFIYIKDRIKRISIVGGINIYPQEVEAVIATVKGVRSVCVARYTDQEGKARTKAFLQLEKGYKLNAKMESLIKQTVEKKVIRYAVPTCFEQVDRIKFNKIGKVDFIYYENLTNKG